MFGLVVLREEFSVEDDLQRSIECLGSTTVYTYSTHLRFGKPYTHSFGTDTHTWRFRPLIVRGTRSLKKLVCSSEYWRGVSYHSYSVWVLIVSLDLVREFYSRVYCQEFRVGKGLEGEEGWGKERGFEIKEEDLEMN